MHKSRQGWSNGHSSGSASLASSSGTRPEELVDGSVLLPNFLHLCFLPIAPLEKDTAWGHEGSMASWIVPPFRQGDLRGNSWVRRESEETPGPLSTPVQTQWSFSSDSLAAAVLFVWQRAVTEPFRYYPVLPEKSYWQHTDLRIWEIMGISWVSLSI